MAVCELGGGSGIYQVNADSDFAPAYACRLQWRVGVINTRTKVALALKPFNSVSLHRSLLSFKLLSLCWSSG